MRTVLRRSRLRAGHQGASPSPRAGAALVPHLPSADVWFLDVATRDRHEARVDGGSLAEATLNAIADAVVTVDVDGRVSYVNAGAERLLGCTAADATGRPLGDLCTIVDPSTGRGVPDLVRCAIDRSTAPTNTPLLLLRPDGERVAVEESVALLRDAGHRELGAVLVLRAVSHLLSMVHDLAYRASHDALTGLPNRRLLRERFLEALADASRTTRPMAVALLDLDGLKTVNDSLGHDAGDRLLCSVADRLVMASRPTETISRYGGDEFVVLFADVSGRAQAEARVDQLLHAVTQPHALGASRTSVEVSAGLSVFPVDGATPEALLAHADAAMYQVKRAAATARRSVHP